MKIEELREIFTEDGLYTVRVENVLHPFCWTMKWNSP